jgi:hypothetical protein
MMCCIRLKTQTLMGQLQRLSAGLGAAKPSPSLLQSCQKLLVNLKEVLHELEE